MALGFKSNRAHSTPSPTVAAADASPPVTVILFCVIHLAVLTNQHDLDLTRIFQLIFNALGNVAGEEYHIVIVDLFGLDHDADFAAGLDGKAFFNAFKTGGNLFKLLQTLDVGL